jgi:hypothetical protein
MEPGKGTIFKTRFKMSSSHPHWTCRKCPVATDDYDRLQARRVLSFAPRRSAALSAVTLPWQSSLVVIAGRVGFAGSVSEVQFQACSNVMFCAISGPIAFNENLGPTTIKYRKQFLHC